MPIGHETTDRPQREPQVASCPPTTAAASWMPMGTCCMRRVLLFLSLSDVVEIRCREGRCCPATAEGQIGQCSRSHRCRGLPTKAVEQRECLVGRHFQIRSRVRESPSAPPERQSLKLLLRQGFQRVGAKCLAASGVGLGGLLEFSRAQLPTMGLQVASGTRDTRGSARIGGGVSDVDRPIMTLPQPNCLSTLRGRKQ